MRKALIVYGGMELHTPRRGAEVVRDLLEPEGFLVTVTPDYDALGAEDVGDNALVVPVITDGQLAPEKMARLVGAIQVGTGLAGYHMGLATSFRSSVPFRYAASCYWVSHPGNIVSYRVDVTRPDHPILEGIESFEHTSEQYYLNYDPAVEVLATTDLLRRAPSLALQRGDAGGVHHHAWQWPGVLFLARAYGGRVGDPASAYYSQARAAVGGENLGRLSDGFGQIFRFRQGSCIFQLPVGPFPE